MCNTINTLDICMKGVNIFKIYILLKIIYIFLSILIFLCFGFEFRFFKCSPDSAQTFRVHARVGPDFLSSLKDTFLPST